LVTAAIPEHAHDKPIELWWRDEARIGQQGSLTCVWADKGNRIFDTYAAIVDVCCDAWIAFVAAPDTIRSIATRAWTTTVNP
jgi:hypothetical protein